MSKKVKIFAIVVVVLSLGIFGVTRLQDTKSANTVTSTSPLTTTTGTAPLPGAPSIVTVDEFSILLSNVKRITIDTSILQNNAYKLLRDFPVSLGSEIIGRNNPFAPIGTDQVQGGSPQSIVVQTLQTGKITSTTAEFGAQVTLSDTVPTTVMFEYGTNDTFGSATPPVVVTKSGTTLSTVMRLLPETTYYVRAAAARGSTSLRGEITSFTTPKK